MKAFPILFSAPLVRAILDGRKTVTRRIVKPQPAWQLDGFHGWSHNVRGSVWRSGLPTHDLCPHGKRGDRLYVRETWRTLAAFDGIKPADLVVGTWIKYDANNAISKPTVYPWSDKARPSIFMPRWASRITMEIADVRVERLREITEEDAKAEGVDPWGFDPEQSLTSGERAGESPYRSGFAYLWDCINDERATWLSNPFVWRIAFRRVVPA